VSTRIHTARPPPTQAAALVSKLPADEAGRVKAASIVRSLGVSDGPGFDALMDALTEDQQGGRA
jgi:hypothetical protein